MILDRATMAYSLESRSPFLDPRFAEFMARVPTAFKVRRGRLRYLERRLGERYLPPEVLRRKKQGFASPLMYIMGAEVRRLAPRLLQQSALVRDGYLRGERVGTLVQEHLSGRRDHGNRIWLLLTAELWYRHYVSRDSVADLELELAPRARRRGVGGGERVAGWGNGVGEIRTHEGVAPLAVFKTAAFNHSATTPGAPKALWASGHRQVGSARSCIPDAVSCGVRNRR